jgi:probable rRNA maturation factor
MSKYEINIYIEPKIKTSVKETWFKTKIKKILEILCPRIPSELGLVITNNKMIQMLNKIYRNKDEPTDVLAFSMDPIQNQKKDNLIYGIAPDGISHLGELIISYPEAIAQAENKGHDIKSELLILMIHGILHLFGYDHEESNKEARRMKNKEQMVLKELSIK